MAPAPITQLTAELRLGITLALAAPSMMRAVVEGRLDAAGNFTPDKTKPAGSAEAAFGRLTTYLNDKHSISPAALDADKNNIKSIFDTQGLIIADGIEIAAAFSAFYAPGKPCPDTAVEKQMMTLTLSRSE